MHRGFIVYSVRIIIMYNGVYSSCDYLWSTNFCLLSSSSRRAQLMLCSSGGTHTVYWRPLLQWQSLTTGRFLATFLYNYNRNTSAEVMLHQRLSYEFTMSLMILIMTSWNPNDVICVSTLSFRSRNTRALILAPEQKYHDRDAIMQAQVHKHYTY